MPENIHETLGVIDKRKMEMLDRLFATIEHLEVVRTRSIEDRGETVTQKALDEYDRSVSMTIGRLVITFRKLLEIEKILPENTTLVKLYDLAYYPDHELIVNAIQDAVRDILNEDPTDKRLAPAEKVYRDTFDRLERFSYPQDHDSPKILAKAVDLYKIVGNALEVVSKALFIDDEFYRAFLQEIEQEDGLRDENTLLQTILSFARSRDKKEIAISAIRFDSDICRRFIMENFDWLIEGAENEWLRNMVLKVESIMNDPVKLEIIFKRLSSEGRLFSLTANSEDIICATKEFVDYIVGWALENLSLVQDDDLRHLAYVASYVVNDSAFSKLIDELEKRSSWTNIAYIRTCCTNKKNRHYAQRILDRNVDRISLSVDDGGRFALANDNDPDYDGPSVFAMIGTIGLDEKARLRAVERIKTEGGASRTTQRKLETILKGYAGYRNATVEEAAKQALDELIKREGDKS